MDWSGIPLRDFVQRNWRTFGALQDVRFGFARRLAEDDIRDILESVLEATVNLTNVKPFFTCLSYNARGEATNVTCDFDTTADCGGLGVAACTLHYKDVNVTETLPPGEGF